MKKLSIVLLPIVLGACATPAPSLQSGPDAERTVDGLVRVDNARFDVAYADPEIDFGHYRKVMSGGARFEFRAVPKTSTSMLTSTRANQREFWISDENRQRLVDTVSGIFAEEIAQAEGWEMVDEPGPDVLMIRGALLDIVSYVPPDMVGRDQVFLRSMGEATIVVEGVDSMSGEVVFRAAERRAFEQPGNRLQWANPVTTWAEVRRWARRYGTIMREGLESIRAAAD